MLSKIRKEASRAVPPKPVATRVLVVMLAVMLFSGIAAADGHSEIQGQLNQFANFVIIVILGVAVPNGAYGFLEWMTAGSSVEKDERGRKRIRNTFIALAGAAMIKGAVEAVSSMMGVEEEAGTNAIVDPELVGTLVDAAVVTL